MSWKNSLFKQNNLSKSGADNALAKNDGTNKKLTTQSGALFPLMSMENIDADEIINNAKAGPKSGSKKEDGENTDTTIN